MEWDRSTTRDLWDSSTPARSRPGTVTGRRRTFTRTGHRCRKTGRSSRCSRRCCPPLGPGRPALTCDPPGPEGMDDRWADRVLVVAGRVHPRTSRRRVGAGAAGREPEGAGESEDRAVEILHVQSEVRPILSTIATRSPSWGSRPFPVRSGSARGRVG